MKLNNRRTVFVGLAFFAICSFWQLYDHVVPLILKYNFGVGDTAAGAVMAIDNVLALFLLPLFGALSDKTSTRIGRRMPYILLGSIGAGLCMLLIPFSANTLNLPLFIIGLGLTLLFMASYRSPAVALMPDVTMKPLRSKANAIINLMGAVGGIIILGLVAALLPKEDASAGPYRPDYFPVFLALLAIMGIATLVLMLTVKEPKLVSIMQKESREYGIAEQEAAPAPTGERKPLPKDVRRSMAFLLASIALWFMGYNAVTTAFSKYCVERFGMGAEGSAMVLMIAQAAAIISYIPVGIIATKVGRKKTILFGVALLAVSFGAGALFQTFSPLLYVLFVLAGVAWASINVNSYPMVVEMAHDADVGRFTGFYYTASMAAQTATPILSGASLEFIGYGTLFPYGALFVGLSFITMLFVKHGDAKPIAPASKLEAFNALDD